MDKRDPTEIGKNWTASMRGRVEAVCQQVSREETEKARQEKARQRESDREAANATHELEPNIEPGYN